MCVIDNAKEKVRAMLGIFTRSVGRDEDQRSAG
jgi:hypothetical protein